MGQGSRGSGKVDLNGITRTINAPEDATPFISAQPVHPVHCRLVSLRLGHSNLLNQCSGLRDQQPTAFNNCLEPGYADLRRGIGESRKSFLAGKSCRLKPQSDKRPDTRRKAIDIKEAANHSGPSSPPLQAQSRRTVNATDSCLTVDKHINHLNSTWN